MKRGGILNGRLNEAVSRLGHGDVVVVADCGLPVPDGVPFVDLAVVHGVPRFTQVLDALLADAVFEGCVAAEEARSGPAAGWVTERFAEVGYVPHADLKALTASARLFLRTGEATAYANVVLRCGVPF